MYAGWFLSFKIMWKKGIIWQFGIGCIWIACWFWHELRIWISVRCVCVFFCFVLFVCLFVFSSWQKGQCTTWDFFSLFVFLFLYYVFGPLFFFLLLCGYIFYIFLTSKKKKKKNKILKYAELKFTFFHKLLSIYFLKAAQFDNNDDEQWEKCMETFCAGSTVEIQFVRQTMVCKSLSNYTVYFG